MNSTFRYYLHPGARLELHFIACYKQEIRCCGRSARVTYQMMNPDRALTIASSDNTIKVCQRRVFYVGGSLISNSRCSVSNCKVVTETALELRKGFTLWYSPLSLIHHFFGKLWPLRLVDGYRHVCQQWWGKRSAAKTSSNALPAIVTWGILPRTTITFLPIAPATKPRQD